MFRRQKHGLLEFSASALCLWAALYHTPVGALGRDAWAQLRGGQSGARPLLAYYSGGVYEATARSLPLGAPPPPIRRGALPPTQAEAMAHGVHRIWAQLPDEARRPGWGIAAAQGVDRRHLDDAVTGPGETARLLGRLASRLRSEDGAVLAFFSGEEPVRYALDRVRASGEEATLEAISRVLPPSQEAEVGRASRSMTLGTAFGLAWPVSESAPITSPFGWRVNPLTGRRQLHTGVDVAVRLGTKVIAAAGGVVRRASEDQVNGKILVIDHGHGVTTAYCHNSALVAELGQVLEPGATVSLSGSSGRSTGPHLHFQLELGHTPIDPLTFHRRRNSLADAAAKWPVIPNL